MNLDGERMTNPDTVAMTNFATNVRLARCNKSFGDVGFAV